MVYTFCLNIDCIVGVYKTGLTWYSNHTQQDTFSQWCVHLVVATQTVTNRVGVNSGIEWELNSIPDSIPGIGLGIGIEKKRDWN